MKYFVDCEFIEDGHTIDLISIGVIAEDGRTLYLQNASCNFKKASDWVVRNVCPSLEEFDMGKQARSCKDNYGDNANRLGTKCSTGCLWRTHAEIAQELRAFCDPDKYGKPEFWGYYCDYDWVAICQLHGTMMDLPKDWPMYCRDIKQWCDMLGNPSLPTQEEFEHNALADAKWNQKAWDFLNKSWQIMTVQVPALA